MCRQGVQGYENCVKKGKWISMDGMAEHPLQKVYGDYTAKKVIEEFSLKHFLSVPLGFLRISPPRPAPWRMRKPGDKPCKLNLKLSGLKIPLTRADILVIDDVTPQKKFYNNAQANILWEEYKEKLDIIHRKEFNDEYNMDRLRLQD